MNYDRQIELIRLAWLIDYWGMDIVNPTAKDVQELHSLGYIVESVDGVLGDVYDYGLYGFSQWENKMGAADLTEVKALLKKVAGNPEQEASRKAALETSFNYITGFSPVIERIGDGFEDTWREALAEHLDDPEATYREFTRILGDLGMEWSRDLERVALTETQDVLLEGQAAGIEEKFGKEDPFVFKQPAPDACPDCMRLYTNGGIPKVFRLSELSVAGYNGRRGGRNTRASWVATLKPLHPYCHCVLNYLPPGFTVTADGITNEAAKAWALTGVLFLKALRVSPDTVAVCKGTEQDSNIWIHGMDTMDVEKIARRLSPLYAYGVDFQIYA